MQVKVQILVENTTNIPGLIGEYGFSALIEAGSKRYLFDTGSAGALLQNASFLGVDLKNLDGIVISHGHFDHTGSVMNLIQEFPDIKVYAHSRVCDPKYIGFAEDKMKAIGTGFTLQELKDTGAEYVEVNDFTEIAEGVFLSGFIPRITEFEGPASGFKVRNNDELRADIMEDEIAMIVDHPDGLIVISGCGHAGIINTLKHAMQKTGHGSILAFIGGTHLAMAPQERIDLTIDALHNVDFSKLIVCHCTGFEPAARLREEFPGRVVKVDAGTVISF